MPDPVIVDGADQLAAGLARAARDLANLDHEPAGRIIADAAGRRAPRRSGRLAAGHRVIPTAGGAQVVNSTPYAVPLHQGWAGNAARPWLTSTAQATQGRWLTALDTAVQGVLDRIKGT